jgi:hypothetical protein
MGAPWGRFAQRSYLLGKFNSNFGVNKTGIVTFTRSMTSLIQMSLAFKSIFKHFEKTKENKQDKSRWLDLD